MASFLAEIFLRFTEFFVAPIRDPLMFWELGPQLLALFITELYFNRYRSERLGWNSAMSNSLVLIFVGSNLLHFLFLEEVINFAEARTLVPLGLIFLGLLLFFMNYFHRWPDYIAFGLSSALVIHTFALASIVIVHLGLYFDWYSIFAMILLLLCFFVFFFVIGLFQDRADAV